MPRFTVQRGKKYRAMISLGFAEQIATNSVIASKLAAAGFTDVHVSGNGRTRVAEAVWPNADVTAELPSQVASVTEIA